MKIQSTKDYHQNGINFLIYGQSGVGKTEIIKTLPKPLILSAESGLLTLKDCDLPYIQIENYKDLEKAYLYLANDPDADQFESVALDSLSEIGEVVLANAKKENKDGRAAYGDMANQMSELIRAFRDLPKTVYFSAKLEKQTDEMGRILYGPSMPGNKLAQALPYFFDSVYALRVEKNPETGEIGRFLMTAPDGLWTAKDRLGLDPWELPDLGAIIRKVKGEPEETLAEVMAKSAAKDAAAKKGKDK